MYDSVTVRLVQYLESKQVTRNQLATDLGVSYSAISNIALGINDVSSKMLEKIRINRPDIYEYITGPHELQADLEKPVGMNPSDIKEELEFIRTIVDRLIAKL